MTGRLRIVVGDRRAQLVVALLAAAVAVLALWLMPARAAITGVQSSGNLQLTQTGAQSALFDVRALAPGEEVSGEVTLGNDGIVPGALKLTLDDLRETVGLGDRPLSEVLVLTLIDTGDGDRVLYRGGLDRLGTIELGSLSPLAKRTFRIAIAWPDGGVPASRTEGDNAYQGARTTFALRWGYQESGNANLVAPGRGGDQAGAASSQAAKTAGGVTLSTTSSSRSARKCVSRRRFTIRVRATKTRRPKSAVVLVGKKRVKVLKGKRLTAVVDLRGLPAQTITVRIRGRTVRNRPYTETRRYRTCVPRPKPTKTSPR